MVWVCLILTCYNLNLRFHVSVSLAVTSLVTTEAGNRLFISIPPCLPATCCAFFEALLYDDSVDNINFFDTTYLKRMEMFFGFPNCLLFLSMVKEREIPQYRAGGLDIKVTNQSKDRTGD